MVMSSEGYERPEDILRDADAAMYQAKREGRAWVLAD
jgi:PleD family two-component response regulator